MAPVAWLDRRPTVSLSTHAQTTRVQAAEGELARVTDEYSRYKTRAHSVLQQQSEELKKAAKEVNR